MCKYVFISMFMCNEIYQQIITEHTLYCHVFQYKYKGVHIRIQTLTWCLICSIFVITLGIKNIKQSLFYIMLKFQNYYFYFFQVIITLWLSEIVPPLIF